LCSKGDLAGKIAGYELHYDRRKTGHRWEEIFQGPLRKDRKTLKSNLNQEKLATHQMQIGLMKKTEKSLRQDNIMTCESGVEKKKPSEGTKYLLKKKKPNHPNPQTKNRKTMIAFVCFKTRGGDLALRGDVKKSPGGGMGVGRNRKKKPKRAEYAGARECRRRIGARRNCVFMGRAHQDPGGDEPLQKWVRKRSRLGFIKLWGPHGPSGEVSLTLEIQGRVKDSRSRVLQKATIPHKYRTSMASHSYTGRRTATRATLRVGEAVWSRRSRRNQKDVS